MLPAGRNLTSFESENFPSGPALIEDLPGASGYSRLPGRAWTRRPSDHAEGGGDVAFPARQ